MTPEYSADDVYFANQALKSALKTVLRTLKKIVKFQILPKNGAPTKKNHT